MNTIQIGRLSYDVTVESPTHRIDMDRPVYVLTGKRGARYKTMRNQPRPELMFLVDDRGFGIAKSHAGLWLTDKNGKLEVAS